MCVSHETRTSVNVDCCHLTLFAATPPHKCAGNPCPYRPPYKRNCACVFRGSRSLVSNGNYMLSGIYGLQEKSTINIIEDFLIFMADKRTPIRLIPFGPNNSSIKNLKFDLAIIALLFLFFIFEKNNSPFI